MGLTSMFGVANGDADVKSPNINRVSQDFEGLVRAYLGQQDELYANEAEFKPKYAELNTGLYNGAVSDAFTKLLPGARTAVREASPEATGLYDQVAAQASDLVRANGELDPAMERQVQQSVRAAQAARGLGYGPGDVAQETFYQGQTREARRLNNMTVAGDIAKLGQTYWGMPAYGTTATGALRAGEVAVGAGPSVVSGDVFSRLLAMPYEGRLSAATSTAANKSRLWANADDNQTKFMSSFGGMGMG